MIIIFIKVDLLYSISQACLTTGPFTLEIIVELPKMLPDLLIKQNKHGGTPKLCPRVGSSGDVCRFSGV
jgi:hypothetical protein